jgi:hypothetical protein
VGITPINPVMEMLIGGVWTDITDDVRLGTAHSGGGVKITRGMPNEGNRVEPTQLDFVLNNTGGKYSPRNESGPNYGKLARRNIPVRFGLFRRTDGFTSRTLTDGWGRGDSWTDRENVTHLGDYWRINGVATNFDVSGGTATVVGATGTQTVTFGQLGDCEVLTRVKVSALTSEFGVVLRMRDPMITAADFENGIGDWVPTGGTLVGSTAQFHTGTASALLTVSGSPANAHARSTEYAVTPGRSYRGRMWVRCSINTTVTGVINWHASAGVSSVIKSSSTTNVAVTANTWTLIEVNDTCPDDGILAIVGPTISGSPANGTLLFVDDVELMESDNFDYYLAGLLPGAPDRTQLRKTSIGNGSSSISVTMASNIVINQYYWIKGQIAGIKRRVRIWKDGDPEPSAWTYSASETNAATQGGNPPKVGMFGLYVKDGSATVTFDSVQVTVWRAHAEVTSLPPRWDLSRTDQWVPIQARGLQRRLGQGEKTVESATTLYFKSYTASLRAWSPLDSFEPSGRTVPNLIDNGAAPVARNLTVGTPDTVGVSAAPGISGFADFAADDSYLAVRAKPGATAGKWSYFNYVRVENAPASDQLFYQVRSSGTATLWKIILQLDRQVRVEAYDKLGTLLGSSIGAFWVSGSQDLPPGGWIAANLYVFDSAGTVTWALNYHYYGSTNFFTINGTFAGSAGTCGGGDYQSNAVLTAAGHLQVSQVLIYPGDLPFVTSAFARAMAGYAGEDAVTRWLRLAANRSIATDVTGTFGGVGKSLGVQELSTTLDLMEDCAKLDGSIQMESRDAFEMNLRTRDSLWNQTPVDLYLNTGHLTEPMEPLDDDQGTRNDITVKRKNGGSARSIQTTGPMNINDPEDDADGVGIYPESPELGYYTDGQLQSVADWRRSNGTLDELRFPAFSAQFHSEVYDNDPATMWALISADTGDILRIFNPEVSAEPTKQLITKYEETIDQYSYDWTATTLPGAIYDVGVVGSTARLATQQAFVQTSFVSGTDTLLRSSVTSGSALWATPLDGPESFPYHVKVNGVRLNVRSVGQVLNANPYFDAGISGWDPVGSTTVYWENRIGFGRTLSNPAGRLTVNPCIRCTSVSAAAATGVTNSAASQAAVTVGETVRISAWIKANVATNIFCQAILYDAGSVFTASVTPPFLAVQANVWTHYSADIVVPATSVFMRVRAQAVLNAGEICWIDDIRMMKPATYAASPQTLQVDQAPVYGVIKTLAVAQRIEVADPWRMAW